ncbi:MAG: PQQ-dependent sugar dehydrogenase [Planctomycetes bacterium]|nr:PQQ-dependent sugar dehydrogenase [Planctomycetota bacterium]
MNLTSPISALPPNYENVTIDADWDQAVGIAFAPDGRMFVWEKSGVVWNVENGVKSVQPLIDVSEEVGNWGDYGMLGFAIDPDFYSNGYIYLMYVVDYHHLVYYGTPNYDPQDDWFNRDTIGRITRYTCNIADGYRSVAPGSRLVLVGESINTGIPICHSSHGVGTLLFGEDGTLLASCGDGASYGSVDVGGPTDGSSNTALVDGIIQSKEDVGAYRSQLVDSLNGKVLRLNPANGDGLVSNPYYDANAPRAARSRVWAVGLRNPYRMTLRPGTGNSDPGQGDPGTLYISDVGWQTWEELNICRGPSENFGWPAFEGMFQYWSYIDESPFNLDAPNPLYGSPQCNEPYFRFRDLIIQDTLDPSATFPNPCDAGQEVPTTLHRFIHRRPAIDWQHIDAKSRAAGYVGNDAVAFDIGEPGSPVAGPQFSGETAIAGVWYSGSNFTPEFQDSLFFSDYSSRWIRCMSADANDNPVEVKDFAPIDAGSIVAMSMDPATGSLYYINYDDGSTIHRVTRVDNLPPVAIATATPSYGPAPLTVQLTGSGSSDPESQTLTFEWDFGDGTPLVPGVNPTHVFGCEDITALGSFTTRIQTLNPPHPLGGGNWDPEVMRDGDLPPMGNGQAGRNYDTYHEGDQGSTDYVGYTFGSPREFRSILFQEGIHFSDGGWFDTINVQFFDGSTWANVAGVVFTPAYAGENADNYETYTITFPPITATGIRLRGNPGGSSNFISIGELRVLATPIPPITTPLAFDVSLTVRDTLNATSSTSLVVSINNTPPVVEILSPAPAPLFPEHSPRRCRSLPTSPTPNMAPASTPVAGRPSCITICMYTPSHTILIATHRQLSSRMATSVMFSITKCS